MIGYQIPTRSGCGAQWTRARLTAVTTPAQRRSRDRHARAVDHALIEAEDDLQVIVDRVIAVEAYPDPAAEATRLAEQLATLATRLDQQAHALTTLARRYEASR